MARFLVLSGWVILGLTLTHCGKPATPGGAPDAGKPGGTSLVVPVHGAYTGAYIDSGDTEDTVTLEAIEEFEETAGKHQAIIAFSSYWGEGRFPADQVATVMRHKSVPLIFWSPWDFPYQETAGPDKFRLDNILAGQWNTYIDAWADEARAAGMPIFVSLCNEMNGDWFPWSSFFYGGGKVVPGTDPPQYVGPELFKRAYRYIVDRVRARGAKNILWVFHVNNFPEPYEKWNAFKEVYPGPDYVDWMGMSAYGPMFPDAKWNDFADIIDDPYEELAAVDATKPMMITEWGVGEFPTKGDKGKWIHGAFSGMGRRYPRVKAAIYWHERWQNSRTLLYSNLRINSSPGALAAYRRGVASPFWLGFPAYR